jgi:hypothetical protein
MHTKLHDTGNYAQQDNKAGSTLVMAEHMQQQLHKHMHE